MNGLLNHLATATHDISKKLGGNKIQIFLN